MPEQLPKLPPMSCQWSANRKYQYVYSGVSTWDKEKKRGYLKGKTSIGRLNGDRVIFSAKFLEKRPDLKGLDVRRTGTGYTIVGRAESLSSINLDKVSVKSFGATWSFDQISAQTMLGEHLQTTHPNLWKECISAAYLILGNPGLSTCNLDVEQKQTVVPSDVLLTSQEMSDLYEKLSRDPEAILEFFKLRCAWVQSRNPGNSYLAIDSTSISTYSEHTDIAAMGHNKDGDDLPQVNVALLVDQATGVPVYCRLLDGSVPDVSTLVNFFRDACRLDLDDFHLVADRGYYSQKNVSLMLGAGANFVVGSKVGLNFVLSVLKMADDRMWRHDRHRMIRTEKGRLLQTFTQRLDWVFPTPLGSSDTAPVYVHLYADNEEGMKKTNAFLDHLNELEDREKRYEADNRNRKKGGRENTDNRLTDEERRELDRFTTRNEKGERQDNWSAIHEKTRNMGVFCIITNDIADPAKAREMYGDRDSVELAFRDLKCELNGDRPKTHRTETLLGKMFVQFIALSIRSVMRYRLRCLSEEKRKLLRHNSLKRAIASLKALHVIDFGGGLKRLQEVTRTQRVYCELLGVDPPHL